jgi:S1-C subfamily serine protease
MRGSALAVIAVVSALLGGTGALGIARAAGWLGDRSDTIVVREQDTASPAAQVDTGSSDDAGLPLAGNGFDPATIYRERADGVVTVFSFFAASGEADAGAAQGSGFVVSEDGYILTNSHVITTAGEGPGTAPKAARRVYVQFRDGDRISADVVGFDLYDDVGVLKVDPEDHELRTVPLGDSSQVVVGEPVAAIGSPFGQESSLSVGVVAATERSIDSLTSNYSLVDAIQTDAPINRGNSGGPLFDARGRAIGINAQIRSETGTAEGVGFAVPINSAIRSMNQLKATGKVQYAWVGITTQTVTPSLAELLDLPAERGAVIQEIVSDSPAEGANLRGGTREREVEGIEISVGGDVIVAIDGETVQSAEDVVRAVTARLPGETATFTIVRGKERLDVAVKLGQRPANPPDLG